VAAMRAQTAAMGIVAAAALSSAASGLPCDATLPGKAIGSASTCTVRDRIETSAPHDEGAATSPGDMEPTGEAAILRDTAEVTDAETFDVSGIKITNLQATMTSNKYVAGHLPLASKVPAVDDLITSSPDYLSIKLLPRVPKRSPVGVGLVTVPKPTAKDAETAAPAQGFSQKRP